MFKIGAKKPRVGDHVQLKGLGLTGYSGTVAIHRGPYYYVRLDPGQVRTGHTTLMLIRSNLRKDSE